MTEKDKDFLEGLAISAACYVLPVRKVFREPIAYSYNGVILPKLPEWDREAYPYAVIVESGWTARPYYLYITDNLDWIGTTQWDGKMANAVEYIKMFYSTFVYMADSNSWVEKVEAANLPYPVWTNYDLYYADNHGEHPGELRMAESEPIPVYE